MFASFVVQIFSETPSADSEVCGLDATDLCGMQQVTLLQVSADIESTEEGSANSSRVNLVQNSTTVSVDYEHPEWLSHCKAIYLDVGSNNGVQIRKFYEPALYPEATVLPLFDKHFGSPSERCPPGNQTGLCVLGMEPNPLHSDRLSKLQQAYRAKGWYVHFYPFAAAYADGTAIFEIDLTDGGNEYWGAGLAMAHKDRVQVRTVNFASFLKSLPVGVALMKMDIEGAEWDVMAGLEEQGLLCKNVINEAYVEVHEWGDVTHWARPRSMNQIDMSVRQQVCSAGSSSFIEMDDELYFHDFHHNANDFGHHSACDAVQENGHNRTEK